MELTTKLDFLDQFAGWSPEHGWFTKGNSEQGFVVDPTSCRDVALFTYSGLTAAGARGGGYLTGPAWSSKVKDARWVQMRSGSDRVLGTTYFFEFDSPQQAQQVHDALSQAVSQCASMTVTTGDPARSPRVSSEVDKVNEPDAGHLTFTATDGGAAGSFVPIPP